MEPVWEKYLKYQELTDFLHELASKYPEFCSVSSIGKTWQGRDIWCAEITNLKTGEFSSKPAIYLDGNTHAGEVTGSMVCLYTAQYLLSNYGKDEQVTYLLDNKTFYVIPRLSADGAELYLNEPYIPRSSIRPWPHTEEQDGLYSFDIDGDGVIAQMRVKDPNGSWRASQKDPRVMVKRKPDEFGGTYYTIYGEGLIRNWDGVEIKQAPSPWGLDVNRNYAAYWQQQHMQPGAGPYPFSEPESRSVADFFESHKNITIAHSFHTFTGAVLRPPAAKPDKDISPKDLKALKEIAAIGTEATGYPCVAIFEEFALNKDVPGKKPLWGVAAEWMFDHAGVIAYSTELWDMPNRAIGRLDTYKSLMDWTEDEQVLMQKWNDENLDGEGFINWRPFEHPQLGQVEIGGWKHKYVLQNPPPKFLEQECHKNAMFCLNSAMTTPSVQVTEVRVDKPSQGVYKLRVVVRNMGYLPTNVTEQAKKNLKASPVKATLEVPEGVEILAGKNKVEIGHLEGRLAIGSPFGGRGGASHLVEWVLKVSAPATVKISVGNERGGRVEKSIALDA